MASIMDAIKAQTASLKEVGPVLYFPDGALTLKLLPKAPGLAIASDKDVEKNLMAPHRTFFNGTPGTKVLVAAVVVDGEGPNLKFKNPTQVRYISLPLTALEAIADLTKRHKPFETKGVLVEVSVNKKGKPVIYKAEARTDLEHFDASAVSWPEISIDKAAEAETEKELEKQAEGSKGGVRQNGTRAEAI